MFFLLFLYVFLSINDPSIAAFNNPKSSISINQNVLKKNSENVAEIPQIKPNKVNK